MYSNQLVVFIVILLKNGIEIYLDHICINLLITCYSHGPSKFQTLVLIELLQILMRRLLEYIENRQINVNTGTRKMKSWQ